MRKALKSFRPGYFFTPIILALVVLCLSAIWFPYHYFTGKEATNLIAGSLPFALALLLPLDLLARACFPKSLWKLWAVELAGLLLLSAALFWILC